MLKDAGPRLDHVIGDMTGLTLPAHITAFTAMGTDFLTRALRAFGVLGAGNAVARITRLAPCEGGSTGAKFFLSVEYAQPDPGLHTDLFLKFSRDFDDDRRDRQRNEMASEAAFVALSRRPGFPIAVPAGYFADYHTISGTGLIITERIHYGQGGIEPHRRKCMDHLTMADPLPYYRAVVTTLARLAAAQKAGTLAAEITQHFPFNPLWGSADRIQMTEAELCNALQQCSDLAEQAPQLLPPFAHRADFIAGMAADARRIQQYEAVIQQYLTSNPDMIALCHWNAHIDNCWFWREDGAIRCGLIDWGRVGQISLGSALWGGLSAAHHTIWTDHIDDLLALFVAEYAAHGGPCITAGALKFHLTLHMAVMGVARILAFPEIIRFRLPDCVKAAGPLDPMFQNVDPARNCLAIYSNFLHWRHQCDISACLDQLLGQKGAFLYA